MNLLERDLDLHDPFAATRMSFGDHLDELRHRLRRAAGGLFVMLAAVFATDSIGYATGKGFGIGKPMLDAIDAPVKRELATYYARGVQRVFNEIEAAESAGLEEASREEVPLEVDGGELAAELAPYLGLAAPRPAEAPRRYVTLQGRIPPYAWARVLDAAQARLTRRFSPKGMSLTEGLVIYCKVALVCSLVLASPWIFWQVWGFLACGLHATEKRVVHFYLPVSLGLFLAGVVGCQFLVMPLAIQSLLGFNEWLGFEPNLRLSEWLSFAIWMPLVFGLSFQTPLVMVALERFGIVTIEFYGQKRRIAWFLLAVLAAAIIPSMDIPSMLLLWVPMGLLYELGIWFCRLAPGHADLYEGFQELPNRD
jgi:sec-independent protein translocase protein TatC